MTRIYNAGVSEARRAWRLEKRMPDERDRPKPSTFEGRKEKALAGQFDIFGNEVEPPQLDLDLDEDEVEQ